jgi:anti-sigma B factor antagonist
MMLIFTKRALQPGIAALAMQGSIHCGPECARLEKEIDTMIAARDTRVVLDMSAVTHADSAAIGSFVRCLSKLKNAGGGLRIAGAQPMIVYSLELTKVHKIIQMFPTVDQAAQSFAPTPPAPSATPSA